MTYNVTYSIIVIRSENIIKLCVLQVQRLMKYQIKCFRHILQSRASQNAPSRILSPSHAVETTPKTTASLNTTSVEKNPSPTETVEKQPSPIATFVEKQPSPNTTSVEKQPPPAPPSKHAVMAAVEIPFVSTSQLGMQCIKQTPMTLSQTIIPVTIASIDVSLSDEGTAPNFVTNEPHTVAPSSCNMQISSINVAATDCQFNQLGLVQSSLSNLVHSNDSIFGKTDDLNLVPSGPKSRRKRALLPESNISSIGCMPSEATAKSITLTDYENRLLPSESDIKRDIADVRPIINSISTSSQAMQSQNDFLKTAGKLKKQRVSKNSIIPSGIPSSLPSVVVPEVLPLAPVLNVDRSRKHLRSGRHGGKFVSAG